MAEVGTRELSTTTKSIWYALPGEDFTHRTEKMRFPTLICTDDCRNILFKRDFNKREVPLIFRIPAQKIPGS